MDVHSPLAKMLTAAAAYIAGFNGDFEFKDIAKPVIARFLPSREPGAYIISGLRA
jgi:dolichyl-phosphate-mannose--protein O-mannosyl transferase